MLQYCFKIITFWAGLTLLGNTCFSQLTYVRSLTVNDGLPQGQVRGMVQDKQGFMWITTEGLSRYDGRSFLNFTHVYGDPTTIASNSIHELEIDGADSLWLVHDNKEIDVLNPTTGRVRHITAEPAFRWMRMSLDEGVRITIRQAGKWLFAVNSNRLIAFDSHTGRRWPIVLPAGERIVALGSQKSKALLATDAALYEVKETGLHKILSFPPLSASLRPAFNKYVLIGSVRVGKIIPYAQQELAFLTPGGIAIYNEQTRSCRYYKDSLALLYSLTQAPDGSLYYINDSNICKFDGSRLTRLTFVNTAYDKPFVPLLADRSGMLWVGALVHGLQLFDLQTGNFRSVPDPRGFAWDVMSNWIPDIPRSVAFYSYALRTAKDTAGSIWVLNHSAVYDEATGKTTSPRADFYRFRKNKLDKFSFSDTSYSIHGFTFDSRNQCWLLLFHYHPSEMVLAKADLGRNTIRPFATFPHELNQENTYLTAIDGKIATIQEHALRLYDTATAACTTYSLEKLGVGSTLLMAVPDPQQRTILWIATKGSGIVKLNIATGATQHYTESDGLPNNVVYYIAPDKKGFFWCSSNKGLFRFNPDDGSTIAFTVKDGLQGNEFNRYHFLETPDGHIWFGGTDGHTVFHPDSVFLDSYQPPVVLTGLRVNDVPLQKLSSHWRDIMTSNLTSIVLPYYQNQLSFSFAGLQYNAPEKLQYRYRLTGINDDWVYAGYDARANYAAIPPGHYVLQINASNTAGQWSQQIKTLEITITPPWWRTWWMYAIYAAILITAGWLYFRSRLRRLQLNQQVVLKQKEAEQAQALEETKSRFFANITHELRTPLTLILSPVQKQLQEGAGTHTPLLQGVYHNSQTLMRLINQLLNMSKLEAGNMPLTLSHGDMDLFVEGIVNTFGHQAKTKEILLTYKTNDCNEESLFDSDKPPAAPVHSPAPVRVPTNRNTLAPQSIAEEKSEREKHVPVRDNMTRGGKYETNNCSGEFLFDSDKLEKILHNLLSNAFKFTPEGGSITVALHKQQVGRDKTLFTIKVADSGIGIAPQHLLHIFDRFYQVNTSTTRRYEGTGIGLSLVKEFADLMGGTIAVESVPGSGSVFTLTLPLAAATSSLDASLVGQPVVDLLPAVEPKKAVENESPATGEKPLVLVTEDNEGLRNFIATSLALHYQVITAENGEAGLQKAVAELPELIISDVMMPVMDGYAFCQRVKEAPLTSHIGFILLTAKTANESRVSGLRLGADHYIGKPFMVEELLLVTANLLKRQQKLRDFYSQQLQQPAEKLLPVRDVEDTFLQSVYTVIENHLDSDKLDVDFLVSEMAVSRRTLNRKLAAIADTSASEVIRNYRLKKAAELLVKGEPVSGVAYATGFSTPSYFSQCFKELYGTTPVQYAKSGGYLN